MGKVLYNIGSIYLNQQYCDLSSLYFKKAIPFLTDYSQYQIQAYRLIGSSYCLVKDYNRALKYLEKGYALLGLRISLIISKCKDLVNLKTHIS